jgi:signal transduction histidine kinase
MNIRTKFTLIFFSIVIIVLTVVSLSIYYFSSNYRELDFSRRLKNRAINTAKVLVEVEEVNANLLRRMERNNPASLPNQYIAIYSQNNDELYSSDGTTILPIDTILLSRIRLKNEIHFNHENYEVIGMLFTEKNERLTVVAAATDVYGLDALQNLRNVLFVTFSISVVLVSILGWIYSGKVLSPISKIVQNVGNITEANLNERLDEGNKNDELGKLAATFNEMLERLQRAFSAQKSFISNASHEIKTPITVMTAEIEVALLQERNKEQYVQVLKSVLGGLKGLNRLSTQLLLLAQTSAERSSAGFATVRIDDILWELKDELTKAFPTYIIDLSFNINLNHEALQIEGDEQLLKVAILNLMDNGCKYSEDHHVTLKLDSEKGKSITVDFINNGHGIEPDVIDKIFDPFFRGEAGKKVKGFGIGLSLASRIIQLHKGTIHVESVPYQKTIFSITLPVKQ